MWMWFLVSLVVFSFFPIYIAWKYHFQIMQLRKRLKNHEELEATSAWFWLKNRKPVWDVEVKIGSEPLVWLRMKGYFSALNPNPVQVSDFNNLKVTLMVITTEGDLYEIPMTLDRQAGISEHSLDLILQTKAHIAPTCFHADMAWLTLSNTKTQFEASTSLAEKDVRYLRDWALQALACEPAAASHSVQQPLDSAVALVL